jgi:DNA-binding SARP family transcriptional activator
MKASFAILGPPTVTADGTCVPIDGPLLRSVAAVLLLAGNQPVSATAMMKELWARPPHSAASNLRTYIARLRAALQSAHPALAGRLTARSDGSGYQLAASIAETDVHTFITLARRGHDCLQAGDPAAAAAMLSAACALWRGPTTANIPDTVTGSIVWKLRCVGAEAGRPARAGTCRAG